ncbi:MAG: hypothetical protein J6V07_03420 [Clostridia bacterium]|nr:hypothetical protein [Clostridia bacterium]
MKRILHIFALILAVSLLFSLVACDNSKSIKAAFEDAGYTVTELRADSDEAEAVLRFFGVSEDDIDDVDDYSLILCKKGITGLAGAAAIVKFPSSGELRDHFVDDGDTSLYDKLKDDGHIRGNCWLVGGDEEIFRK